MQQLQVKLEQPVISNHSKPPEVVSIPMLRRYASYNDRDREHRDPIRAKELEFKYLYFKLQKLLNKKVVLSLKYEQLREPEIHMTIVKPLSTKVIEMAGVGNIHKVVGKSSSPNQTPKFGPHDVVSLAEQKVCGSLVFILLLLRYEYLIQSQNNLIKVDLLLTKANICEILAIRMLREYKSSQRTKMLFISALKTEKFNTLELAILTKSKKFLSQPVIVDIFDKFYNGDLIVKNYNCHTDEASSEEVVHHSHLEEQPLLPESKSVVNYRYSNTSLSKIYARTTLVPKYQSLVINLKLAFFSLLHFGLIINHKQMSHEKTEIGYLFLLTELFFWGTVINLNIEQIIRLRSIEFIFLRKIIWTWVDFTLLFLTDLTFVMRTLMALGKVESGMYYDCFSIISIVLLPRMLSVFNNYEFFNMIILSLKKMVWNMIGLCFLFASLISGFYLSFISLTIDRTNSEIAFDMVKIFFAFTPAVWNNWDSYSNLGRAIQMGYLFLIQFIVGTILAIVLSEVFAKVSKSNREEFVYFKATNLVVYFKAGNAFHKLDIMNNFILNMFKFPIVILIYVYEQMVAIIRSKQADTSAMKNYTFLDKDKDFWQDGDLVGLQDNDDDVSLMMLKSRQNSVFYSGLGGGRRYSQVDNFAANQNFASHVGVGPSTPANALMPVQSIATLGLLRTASTDSLFIDEVLNKKYGTNGTNSGTNNGTNNGSGNLVDSRPSEQPGYRSTSVNSAGPLETYQRFKLRKKRRDEDAKILDKLQNLEAMLASMTSTEPKPIAADEEYPLADGNGMYDIAETLMDLLESLDDTLSDGDSTF